MRTASAAILMLLAGFPAFASDTVDFSGVWKSDLARSESAHQTIPIGQITLIISQTPAEVSIETKTDARDRAVVANETLVFKLDGSETAVTNAGNPVVCKGYWEGSNLVAETTRSLNGATVTTRWVLKLDPTGKEFQLKKTLTVHHGYQSPQAGNVGTANDTFVKLAGSGR